MKKNKIIRWFFNKLYRFKQPEMVGYWKNGDMARAKLTTINGSYAMIIEGEKYPLWGFPRGPVLFGPLAELKHITKNLLFNETWRYLEEGKDEEGMDYIKNRALPAIIREISKNQYHFFPPERLCPAVKELWRAMTAVENRMKGTEARNNFNLLKKGITFFFQEDDAYRFRLQWIAKYLDPNHFIKRVYRFFTRKRYSFTNEIESVLNFLCNAEIVPDMKGRIKLIRRVFLTLMRDYEFGTLIEEIVKELDWKKLKLSKGDTYYFRGKYFKVDADHFDY